MPEYPKLTRMLKRMGSDTSEGLFAIYIIPYLTEIWVADYASSIEDRDIVEVPLEGLDFVFLGHPVHDRPQDAALEGAVQEQHGRPLARVDVDCPSAVELQLESVDRGPPSPSRSRILVSERATKR